MKILYISVFFILFHHGMCGDVEWFNNKRRAFAKKRGIANMWKLELAPDFVNFLEAHGDDACDYAPKFKTDARHFFTPYNARSKVENKEREAYIFSNDPAKYDSTTAGEAEALMPTQRRLGCHQTDGCWVYDANYDKPCLIGPISKISVAFNAIKYGEPGSKCAEEGGVNDDGLCVKGSQSQQESTWDEATGNKEKSSDEATDNKGKSSDDASSGARFGPVWIAVFWMTLCLFLSFE